MNEELKVIITAEIDKLKSAISNAKSEVEGFVSKSGVSLEKFSTGFSKIGDAAKTGLKVAAGAVAGAATALVGATVATEEYREAQAKLVSAFEAAGSSATVAKDTYNDLYRVLGDGDTATEAANHLAKLTTEQEALSEWTNICQGVYATFGDSLPIEGLTEAANETSKTGTLTGSLADALNWAGVAEEDFQAKLDACTSSAEREQLIRETLNGIYDEAATKYEENAAGILAQNEANAKMTESMAKLGEAVQPVLTALSELAAEVMAELAPHIQEVADKYLPSIKEALSGVGDAIGTVIGWIADNWTLVSTIATIVAGIAVAISAVSTALGIYNTVMAVTAVVSAPVIGIIAAVVAGIAALVAAIVLCVQHWDEIKAKTKEVWDAIVGWVTAAVDKVKEVFNNMKEAISNTIDKIKTVVSEKWNAIKDAVSNTVENIKTAVTNKWNAIKDGVSKTVDNIKTAVSNKWNDIKTSVSNTVDNIKTTVSEKWNSIKTTVGNVVDNIKTAVSEKWNAIKTTVGTVATNIKDTVSEKFNQVKETMGTVMQAAKDTISEKLNNIKAAYEEHGGGVKGIVAASMEAIKGYYSAGYTFIDNLTNGKLSAMVDTIKSKLESAKNTVSNILNAIKDKFSSIFESAKNIVSNAIEKIKGFFNFKWELPKIKLPHFSITGKFSLNPPQIPKFSVEWYKLGGVFDEPTLFGYGDGKIGGLGEDGAEAIVPLERNTAWLDRLAEMLNDKMGRNDGGARDIILQVDGKTFGKISVDSINDLTRQTGSLPLKLV
jgi:phage-related minor tail protein